MQMLNTNLYYRRVAYWLGQWFSTGVSGVTDGRQGANAPLEAQMWAPF